MLLPSPFSSREIIEHVGIPTNTLYLDSEDACVARAWQAGVGEYRYSGYLNAPRVPAGGTLDQVYSQRLFAICSSSISAKNCSHFNAT